MSSASGMEIPLHKTEMGNSFLSTTVLYDCATNYIHQTTNISTHMGSNAAFNLAP